jgi:hypothetical protein
MSGTQRRLPRFLQPESKARFGVFYRWIGHELRMALFWFRINNSIIHLEIGHK